MKYECLILDHDDTAVDSTAEIHYPAHRKTMELMRPEMDIITLDEWFLKNFHPGIMEYLRDELLFTEDEIEEEYRIWQDYTRTRIPQFYPGFLDVIKDFKKRGGRVAVVSHSSNEFIQRDYENAGAGDIPEMIFGWHIDSDKRKPSAYPVECILKEMGINRDKALILDDLKPAVIMGRNSGVRVAGAGWGHSIPEIRQYMKDHCDYFLSEIEDLEELILA